MYKRKSSIVIAVFYLVMAFLPQSIAVAAAQSLPRLVDEAGLLTEEEESGLLEALDEVSERQQCDVVIVTVDGLQGKTPEAYADDFYDYNGYGMGENRDGILLLVSMKERNWAISTCGFGIRAFTDAGQEYIVKQFKPYLSDGDYHAAFMQFADLSDRFIEQAKTAEPYDTGSLPKERLSLLWIFPAFAVGFILALIMGLEKESKLKSVVKQEGANAYMSDAIPEITVKEDRFLNVTVVRRKIENSSHASGGSSTHTSSSGTRHGGSSGSF